MLQFLDIDPLILCRETDEGSDKRLLNVPRIIQVGEFDSDAARTFSEEMSAAHMTGQPVIPVVINSTGGDVYALLQMVDIIRKSRVPVATIIEGQAVSCGAVLFTCGAEGLRYISPNASLMIHDVVSGSEGRPEDMKVDVKETERLNKQLYALMEHNIGKPKNYLLGKVKRRARTDWYLTPEKAKEYNLANHIGTPSFHVRVSVDMRFGP